MRSVHTNWFSTSFAVPYFGKYGITWQCRGRIAIEHPACINHQRSFIIRYTKNIYNGKSHIHTMKLFFIMDWEWKKMVLSTYINYWYWWSMFFKKKWVRKSMSLFSWSRSIYYKPVRNNALFIVGVFRVGSQRTLLFDPSPTQPNPSLSFSQPWHKCHHVVTASSWTLSSVNDLNTTS